MALLLSFEWNLIRLGGPAHGIVNYTQNSARGWWGYCGGGQGVVGSRGGLGSRGWWGLGDGWGSRVVGV